MEKIKQLINEFIGSERGKDILTVFIVILVGLGSFELGRLSKENSSSGIKIEYLNQDLNQGASVVLATESTNKTFFASKQGTKYYSIGCSAGKTIKQENRIYFATSGEAERAGYELSSSCR